MQHFLRICGGVEFEISEIHLEVRQSRSFGIGAKPLMSKPAATLAAEAWL